MYANVEDNANCVDMYMASLWRDGHVIQTIKSLLKQPELKTLTVVLNNYTDEQAAQVEEAFEPEQDRIRLIRGNNAKCSNEKFHYMYTGTAKYIAFADDDIIYPEDYLMKLIAGCNVHEAAVSLHGGRLREFPTKKYYNGGRKMFSWNVLVSEDTKVDIIGNGVGLFKREWFTKKELKGLYDKAPAVSMDDIILSCELAKKGIERYVIAHMPRLVHHKIIRQADNYVYDRYKNTDSFQVGYINASLSRDMLVH
jgi:GT2 family glycosyltransferase